MVKKKQNRPTWGGNAINRVRSSAQCFILFGFGQEFSFRCIPNRKYKWHLKWTVQYEIIVLGKWNQTKKGKNKISKSQKADITKKAVYELLNEDENEASRNASYTPAVGFFFPLSLSILYILILHIYQHLFCVCVFVCLFVFVIDARERWIKSFIPHYGAKRLKQHLK